MARPERHDVDYFPFIVKDGKTLFILESQYGCAGTGFFTNVMRFLCRTPDHHFRVKDDSDRLFFFSKCHTDEVSGAAMLEIMLQTGKLDRDLWEKARVVACADLLDSLKDAYRKRSNEIITMEKIRQMYLETDTPAVTAEHSAVKDDSGAGNESNGAICPQSKVKKRKVNNPPTPLRLWPEDFFLTDHLRALASKYIPPDKIDLEWELFKSAALAKSLRYSDWERAWTTRYLNYAKYSGGGNNNTMPAQTGKAPNSHLQAEALKCFAKCRGTCAATWLQHKDNHGSICHWCQKFEKVRMVRAVS